MNVESSPKSYFDRQIQSFQFKIQQKLTLWDEEIERLSNRLNMTKSQIHYEKQRIEQLDREISNAIEYKDGEARQKTASFNAIIARAKANYHAQLQSMQTQHMEEITQLQHINFIGEKVFSDCLSLKRINIPSSLKLIN